jgi:hypothetical protein
MTVLDVSDSYHIPGNCDIYRNDINDKSLHLQLLPII